MAKLEMLVVQEIWETETAAFWKRPGADPKSIATEENPDPTDEQIRHYLTGNLCRCATYPEVMDAVKLAAKKRKAGATT